MSATPFNNNNTETVVKEVVDAAATVSLAHFSRGSPPSALIAFLPSGWRPFSRDIEKVSCGSSGSCWQPLRRRILS